MFRGRMKPIMLVVALLSVILGVPAAAVAASGLRPDGVPADYPNKEIQYIYAFSPGSIQDAYIRKLADKIQKMEGWKHGIIVVYREGASGRIGWCSAASFAAVFSAGVMSLNFLSTLKWPASCAAAVPATQSNRPPTSDAMRNFIPAGSTPPYGSILAHILHSSI